MFGGLPKSFGFCTFPGTSMGGGLSIDASRQANRADDRRDWFSNQGYALHFDIKVNQDASTDCNRRIFNNGKYDCMLPIENCATTKLNNDIYQYIQRVNIHTQESHSDPNALSRLEWMKENILFVTLLIMNCALVFAVTTPCSGFEISKPWWFDLKFGGVSTHVKAKRDVVYQINALRSDPF